MNRRLGFAGVALFALASAGGEPVGDAARLQGTWACASMERNGKAIAPDEYRDGLLAIEGEAFTYTLRGRLIARGTRTLDPSRTPKTFDDAHTAGSFAGKTYRGIYKLEGDTLTTCNGSRGQDRPTEFATRAGSGLLLATYERVGPKAKP